MKHKQTIIYLALTAVYGLFIGLSFFLNFAPGKEAGNHFANYFLYMFKIVPLAFVLISLFEVWVKRETVERHLGKDGGFISYLWAILLGGTTIGPMIVALPAAQTLYKKGARLSVLFTYIGAASVCRIPMTILEASYLGVKFTLIRYAVSIPLVLVSSLILGALFSGKDEIFTKEAGS